MSRLGLHDCDIALVGAGLANGLIALRLAAMRPDLDVRLFEAGEEAGGNHTWSFHEHDLPHDTAAWIAPLVASTWPAYEVRFPARRRRLATGYRSVSAERFREVLGAALRRPVETGCRVVEVGANHLVLEEGRTIRAGCVIDGRGHEPSRHLALRFQKFLGVEIETAQPHGLAEPIVMDATVPQADGYRFVYCLPFSPTRMLVEDTYYSDGADLPIEALRERIGAYCNAAGWRERRLLREEHGILPIALGGDIEAFWREKADVPASGLAAALFHPTTGYSLPDAARLAEIVADLPDLSARSVFSAVRDHSIRTFQSRRFFRMLNKMLFLAGDPARRFEILQHFHRLPDDLIARFYAGRLTGTDKLRILAGRPPVPVHSALRALVSPVSGAAA